MATLNASFLQLDDTISMPVLMASWLQLQSAPAATIPADVSNVIGDATSDTEALITWADNSGDELGFDVELEVPAGSGNWVAASGDANPAAPGVQSFSASGLSPSNPVLTPRVRAFGSGGAGNWVLGAQFALDNAGGGGAPIPTGFTGVVAAVEDQLDTAQAVYSASTTHFATFAAIEGARDRAHVVATVASSRVAGGMLASLAAEFTLSRSQVGLFIDYVQVLDCAIRATRYFAGWAHLEDPTSNMGVFTITGATTVLPDEWAIIFPLFLLYVERESAIAIESSRVAGVDAVGRDSASVEGDIRQAEAEMPQKAFVEPVWSVGFPSTVS